MKGIELTCGFVEVPEDRSIADGRTIPVHFVRASATGDSPRPDPIVFLGGGPGLNATPDANMMIWRNRERLKQRDLIIADQRGTGRSNPLDCINHEDDDPEVVRDLFKRDFFDGASFRRCRDELSGRADLAQYTTTASVEDLEVMRSALGYASVNLFGGSYGTRWALEYMRRHPKSVRSATLFGVAPPSELLVGRVARDFQRTLDSLVDACESDAACAKAYPSFREQLHQVLERVRREPVEAGVAVKGERVRVRLNYEQLVTALRFMFYSVNQSAALPAQVQAAAGGDYGPFVNLYTRLSIQLHNGISEGLWASVKCAEELPFIDVERARKQSAGTVLGTLRLESELEICSVWPRGDIPGDFNDPVVSKVPALLFAGEFDPATPVELAEEAARHLPNGLLVRVPNRSHWGLSGRCVDTIVDSFLDGASVAGIDASCASAFKRPAFAID
jgi:pimeloyl-ACP methyl ester carboxylesterase